MGGRLQVVADMLLSDKAAQSIMGTKVTNELARITKLSNDNASTNRKARGVIKHLEDQNKKLAAQATKALSDDAHADIKKLRSKQAADVLGFKKDLTSATEKLYKKLSDDEMEQNFANSQMTTTLNNAKALFASRTLTLTNAITANQRAYEAGMEKATEQSQNWEKASAAGRANIRATRKVMVDDLDKHIVRAIELGEAKMKQVQEEATANIEASKKALLTTIGESVENMADNVFATVNQNRQKIADNYLSLKAYAATAADQVQDYLEKGKGRNLSSLGDLLKSIGGLKDVKAAAAKGVGFGAKTTELPFSGSVIKADDSVSKVNGLVNEYLDIISGVKDRWPLGLGKYLIAKLEVAMQGTGALEVDKISDKAGNFVFVNAHAVGLSSKLSDFETLAVRMTH